MGWGSRARQLASIACVVVALVALWAFDESVVFWVFIAGSLAIALFDLREQRRSSH